MVGRVGISSTEFWNLTPHYTLLIFNQWAEQQSLLQKNEWERIRWQTGCLYNLNVKRTQQRSPAKWFKLPWDDEQNNKPDSPPNTKEKYLRFKERVEKTKWNGGK